jgi:hypothetical protein
MRREFHVRFSEGPEGQLLRATRLVVGFEHEEDGRRFFEDLRGRLRKFELELHQYNRVALMWHSRANPAIVDHSAAIHRAPSGIALGPLGG